MPARFLRHHRRLGRRGLYEILLTFFSVIVIVSSVIFFLALENKSAILYALLKRDADAPLEAITVKDALLECHKRNHLEEALMENPCRAKELLSGYRVIQLDLNDCDPKEWDYSRGQYNSVIPFVVAVKQQDARICLARLEVLV